MLKEGTKTFEGKAHLQPSFHHHSSSSSLFFIIPTMPIFFHPMIGVDEAVIRNIEAAKQLAQIVRTSLGPNGEFVEASGSKKA